MFTVEFESDASIITSLDETGEMNDIEMIVSECDKVYVRQWDEDLEKYEMIIRT